MKKDDLIRLIIIDAQTDFSSQNAKTSQKTGKSHPTKSPVNCSVESKPSDISSASGIPDSLVAQIKSAVFEAVRDLKDELHREHQAQINDLEAKFSREVAALQTEFTALKEKVDSSLKKVEYEFLNDLRESEQRKDNVMIFGLMESLASSPSESNEHDLALIKSLSSKLGVQHLQVRNCFRLGQRTNARPRPIKLTCQNSEQRLFLLRSAFRIPKLDASLGFSRVFVKPDLTRKEQEAERQLHLELKMRREAGEDIRIRDGCIITKKPVQYSS